MAKKQEINLINDEVTELAVAPELDDLYGDAAGEGFEAVTSSDVKLPRLMVMQPTSPHVTEDPEAYKPGDLVNSVTGENYGKTITFHPLHYFNSKVHWESPEPGSKIECRSSDGLRGEKKDARHAGGNCAKCPFSQWEEEDSTGENTPPTCTEFKNILLILVDGDGAPLVFSGKRTAIKAVTDFISRAMLLRRKTAAGVQQKIPIFGATWSLSTAKQKRDNQVWYVPEFKYVATLADVQTFTMLRALSQEVRELQSRVVIDDRTDTVEGVYTESAADDNGEIAF